MTVFLKRLIDARTTYQEDNDEDAYIDAVAQIFADVKKMSDKDKIKAFNRIFDTVIENFAPTEIWDSESANDGVDFYVSEDAPVYLYETVMESIFGKNVWDNFPFQVGC